MRYRSSSLRKSATCLILAGLTYAFVSANLMAQVPESITLQGYVTDSEGEPLTGYHSLTVTLYADSGAVYSETQSGTSPDGRFNMHIGPLHEVVFGQPLQFGVTIDSDPEMPREELESVPYALGLRGLRVQNTSGAPNLIGGGLSNAVESSSVGATVGGGGGDTGNHADADYATVGGGGDNLVSGAYGTVSGGLENAIGGVGSTIGGGVENVVSMYYGFVGGGLSNEVSGSGGTVSGGQFNEASGGNSVIGGGENNRVTGNNAVVGGGTLNLADDANATVAGGIADTASGYSSAVGGGVYNVAEGSSSVVGGGINNRATGAQSAIPGGSHNIASGERSFAAGSWARAYGNGSFVWQDATGTNDELQLSALLNQFRARASGGFYLHSSSAPDQTTGVILPGGSGTWSSLSSRDSKTAFTGLDELDYLERVASMDVMKWSYKTEEGVTHAGPMAEDFYAAFGLGPSEESISTVDADGVALAAIQGLYQIVKQQQAEIERLRRIVEGGQ